jgi:signal transduction histidine kinase
MDVIVNHFLKFFPRPHIEDAHKRKFAALISDIVACSLLILLALLAQGLVFGQLMPVNWNIYLSCAIAYLCGVRMLLKGGQFRLILLSFVFGLGFAHFFISLKIEAVFHAHLVLLCAGIFIAASIQWLTSGLRIFVGYVLTILAESLYLQNLGVLSESFAYSLFHLLVMVGVLGASLGITDVVRSFHLTKTGIAHSERNRAMEQLQRSISQLEAVVKTKSSQISKTLDASDQQKGEHSRLLALANMVFGLSHELGSPMGTALSTATAMRQWSKQLVFDSHAGSEVSMKMVHRIQEACDVVTRNILDANRLLNSFKRVSVDTVDGRVLSVSVYSVIEYCLVSMKPLTAGKDIQFRIDVEKTLMVETFKSTLERILFNIIENAIIHGLDRRSGAVLHFSAINLPNTGLCRIEVHDNGWGIEETLQSRIFEPFFTTKRGQGSIGLGMFVAHHLVTTVLKGTISLHSDMTGSQFVIEFPSKTPSLILEKLATSTQPATLI